LCQLQVEGKNGQKQKMNNNRFTKAKLFLIISTVLSLVFYWLIAHNIKRSDFYFFFPVYVGLFINFLLFLKLTNHQNFKIFIWLGISFRLLFIFSIPTLSNDYFRFIWDGNLISEGLNPYSHLPSELITQDGFKNSYFYNQLYEGMGNLSANNYTNYPPLNQLLFWLPSIFSKSIIFHIIFYRVIMIAADVGTLIISMKLLKILNINEKNILLYFLNPFIIIELTGNLHFEAVMIFFLVLSFYLLQINKRIFSSVFFAFAVLIKLIPLIFLPFIIRKTGIKRGFLYSVISGAIILVSFLPFLDTAFLENYTSSINLWFQKFEFNASIYYLVREIGYMVKGYNIIQSAGPVLSIISTVMILSLVFVQKNDKPVSFYSSMLFGLFAYYLFATTVHPWYISVLLILSVFTGYRFVVVWSFFIILSYYSYSSPVFKENLWLNVIEYVAVLGFLTVEIFILKKTISEKYMP